MPCTTSCARKLLSDTTHACSTCSLPRSDSWTEGRTNPGGNTRRSAINDWRLARPDHLPTAPGQAFRMGGIFRLPIVGVIGSGTDAHQVRAAELGSWLANQGVHLLTGAGQGGMGGVSRVFGETAGRRGLVLGIISSAYPEKPETPHSRYPQA